MENEGQSLFDITMGGYPGAEKSDLVGLYLLDKIKHLEMNPGMFRDDGIAVSSLSKKYNENLKKEICKIFKKEGLDITIEVNLKIVEFLDVELNLLEETHRPYTKPNNTILYIYIYAQCIFVNNIKPAVNVGQRCQYH